MFLSLLIEQCYTHVTYKYFALREKRNEIYE
jgi:hypothetical protein